MTMTLTFELDNNPTIFPRKIRSVPWMLVLCFVLGYPPVSIGATETDNNPTIVETPSTIDDEKRTKELNELFSRHHELNAIRATSTAGIIQLTGEVPNPTALQLAEQITKNFSDAEVINNQIALSLSVTDRLEPALENSVDRLQSLVGYLPLMVVATLVVVLFWFLARTLSHWDAPFRRLSKNPFLQQLIKNMVSVAVLMIGILFALEILDAMALVGAVLGTAGVAGLALGLAFRDTVENYIAGLLLSIRQPFEPFDSVQIEGYEGQVVRMTSRATVLMGFDGNHIRIPNAKVFQGTMVNFSRNPRRRFDFSVGISTDVDLVAAQALAVNTLQGLDSILDKPGPSSIVETLGDSNVVLRIYGWVDQRASDFKKVKSQAIRCIKQAFDDAEYEMPEPIYRLRVNDLARQFSLGKTSQSDESSLETLTDTRRSVAFSAEEETLTDTKPDNTIEEHIREERATEEEEDLLDIDAPKE